MKVQALKALSLLTPFNPLQNGALARASSQNIPKVPSLLFDIELEDGKESKPNETDQLPEAGVIQQLKSLLHPWSTQEAHLTSHVRLVQDVLLGSGQQKLDVLEVAEGLRRLGHSVVIRTALGGGGGGECLRNLRHTFLTCTVSGSPAAAQHPVSYIVDPAFREQFEIPHVSTRYAAILAHLPRVFIGTEERVGPLVELLCSEIGAAFKLAGATLPPWRASPAMLSKWRPRKSTDCVLGDVDGAGLGQAPLLLDAAPLQSRAASMPVPQNFPAALSLTAGAGRRPSMPAGLVARRNSDSKPHLSSAVQLTVHRAGSLGEMLDVEQAAPRARPAQSQLSSLSPAFMAARHMLHVL